LRKIRRQVGGHCAHSRPIYYQSSITTYAGQSGSPVWRSSTRVVYGVHFGGSRDPYGLNFATRITRPIFNALQSRRASDAHPGRPAGPALRIGGGTIAFRVNHSS
jgi:hypothetical protein